MSGQAVTLSMEARLVDSVSKNLNYIIGNVKNFGKDFSKTFSGISGAVSKAENGLKGFAEGVKGQLEKAKEAPEHLNSSFEKLERTLRGRGGIIGFAAKFAGLALLFRGVEESLDKVFESAMEGSPALEEGVEKVKGKVNQLVTEVGQKLTPVFINITEFMLENWEKIRFSINLVVAAVKDFFDLLVLGTKTLILGFDMAKTGLYVILNALHLMDKKTLNKAADEALAYGNAVAEAGDKLKLFGNIRDTIDKGVAGQGKSPKANIDIFAKKDKKEDELAKFRVELAKKNNELVAESAVEGMKKELEASKAKFDNINLDITKNKEFAKLSAKERYEFLNNLEKAAAKDSENITKKFADADKAYKEKVIKETRIMEVDSMAEGINKELEKSKVKYDLLHKELVNDKMFAILSKQDQQNAITAIEKAAAQDRARIIQEENKRKAEEATKFLDAVKSTSKAAGDFVIAFGFRSEASIKKSTDKQIAAIDNQFKHGTITQEQADKAKARIEKEATKRNRERAIAEKRIAEGEAIINVAQGITKAYAQGGVLGLITGVGVGLAGAAEIEKIEAQEFLGGGIIPGRNTLIKTNEDGRPEAILNANAVSRLGTAQINRLNNGGNFEDSSVAVANTIHYSPTISISGKEATAINFHQLLEENKEAFFKWFQDQSKKGYKVN